MKPEIRKDQGQKVQDVFFFTNTDQAYNFGEDMCQIGWAVAYEPTGNCLAVTLSEKFEALA